MQTRLNLRTAPQASHVEELAIGAFDYAADLVAFKEFNQIGCRHSGQQYC